MKSFLTGIVAGAVLIFGLGAKAADATVRPNIVLF
jgi:hypothetical protein